MKFEREAEKLYGRLEREEQDGKVSYFKKRKVYPFLNEDGSINWFNFLTGGSWWKLIGLIIIIGIIVGLIIEYHSNVSYCAKILSEYNNITGVEGMNISLGW